VSAVYTRVPAKAAPVTTSPSQRALMRTAMAAGNVAVFTKRDRAAALKLAENGYLERVPGGSYLTGIRYKLKTRMMIVDMGRQSA
jgi:hypothetical protein